MSALVSADRTQVGIDAAITVAGPAERMDDKRVEEIAGALVRAIDGFAPERSATRPGAICIGRPMVAGRRLADDGAMDPARQPAGDRRRLCGARRRSSRSSSAWSCCTCLTAAARSSRLRRSPTSLSSASAGTLREATVRTRDHTVEVTPKDGASYVVGFPAAYGQELIEGLEADGVPFTVKGSDRSTWEALAPWALLIAVVVGFAVLLGRRMRNGGGGASAMRMRKAPARQLEPRSTGLHVP